MDTSSKLTASIIVNKIVIPEDLLKFFNSNKHFNNNYNGMIILAILPKLLYLVNKNERNPIIIK